MCSVCRHGGRVGLAIGFGAQKLVKDVISGFFLLLEDQFAVGSSSRRAYGGRRGRRHRDRRGDRIRTTRLRDDEGRLYILSNGDITQVCNYSRGAVMHAFEIGIAATADVAEATRVLTKRWSRRPSRSNSPNRPGRRGIRRRRAENHATHYISRRANGGARSAPPTLHFRYARRHGRRWSTPVSP
jgi:hypothetical protein